MKKNLIIGTIANYVWEDLEPFFVSYVRAGFENTDCVMFTYNISRRTLNKIRACGVKILPMSQKWISTAVNNYRWKLYDEFLNVYHDEYKFVLALDVRDSVFQSDIFKSFDEQPFLGLAIEDGDLTERINKEWIIEAHGKEIYGSIQNERIVCTGTIFGTCEEFRKFSQEMSKTIFSRPRKIIQEMVIDQAAGNVIAHYNKTFLDVIKFSDNISGSIMTIALTDPANIKLDANGNIFNGAGDLPAVIHQYDRKRLIVAMVKAKYCEPVTFKKKLIGKFDRLMRKPVKVINKLRRMLVTRS